MSLRIPPRQDPNVFARQYAQINGISFKDAKEELKAKYGNPVKPTDESIFNEFKPADAKDPAAVLSSYMDETGKSKAEAKADLETKYGKPQKRGPKNDTPPFLQRLLDGFMNRLHVTGGNNDGPKKEGDPNPFGKGISGPTKPGDPDPKKDDPDVAAQKYADENGITLEEARAKLKELYGDPGQRK